MKKKFFKIYPPYIDAYLISWGEENYISFKEFKNRMVSHAMQWGEQSIGAQFLKGDVKLIDNKPILCCGCFGDKKYVLVAMGAWWVNDDYQILEYDYSGDYDVT